jgi:fatty acid desaturase
MRVRHSSAVALRQPEAGPEAVPVARPTLEELSQPALYRRFKPLFRPRPIIYWSDMLASAVIGWTAFATFLLSDPFGPIGFLAYAVAVAALYRAVLFIHEIAHLKHGSIDGFPTGWNLLVGIPLAVPSLMYTSTHADHHRRSQFGTSEDPEYEAIASWKPARIVTSFLTMLAVPAILVLRWSIVGPLSYVIPPLRRLVVERASTLVINPGYRRAQLKTAEVWDWAWQEWLLAAYLWGVALAAANHLFPLHWLARWYAVPAAILILNHARTLAAHRYDNDSRRPVDRMTQLLDSINLTGSSWMTMVAAPVGLRYHALHHLLPTLPYHSLGAVHHALERELPLASPYRETSCDDVMSGLRALLEHARRNARRAAMRSYTSRRRYSALPPKPNRTFGAQAAATGGSVPVWPAETDRAVADQ